MSMREIQSTTLADLEVMRKAYELRMVDAEYMASFTAWQMAVAQGTDKNGKPIHRDFKSLFDYKKIVEIAKGNRKENALEIDRQVLELVASANKEV